MITPDEIKSITTQIVPIGQIRTLLTSWIESQCQVAKMCKMPEDDIERRRKHLMQQVEKWDKIWWYAAIKPETGKATKKPTLTQITGTSHWKTLKNIISDSFHLMPVEVEPKDFVPVLTFAPTKELKNTPRVLRYRVGQKPGTMTNNHILYRWGKLQQIPKAHLHLFDLRAWYAIADERTKATFTDWSYKSSLDDLNFGQSRAAVINWIISNVLMPARKDYREVSGLKAYLLFCKSMLPHLQTAIAKWNAQMLKDKEDREIAKKRKCKLFVFRFQKHSFSKEAAHCSVWFGELYHLNEDHVQDFKEKNPNDYTFAPELPKQLFEKGLTLFPEDEKTMKNEKYTNKTGKSQFRRLQHPTLSVAFWKIFFNNIMRNSDQYDDKKATQWPQFLQQTNAIHPVVIAHFFESIAISQMLPVAWERNIQLIVEDRVLTAEDIEAKGIPNKVWKEHYLWVAKAHQRYAADIQAKIFPEFPSAPVHIKKCMLAMEPEALQKLREDLEEQRTDVDIVAPVETTATPKTAKRMLVFGDENEEAAEKEKAEKVKADKKKKRKQSEREDASSEEERKLAKKKRKCNNFACNSC